MRKFGKRIDPPGGRRVTPRQRVVLTGSASASDVTQSVVVEDVGSTGAKLRGHDLPDVGTRMLLTIGGMEVTASVAWRKEHECGITFDASLDHDGVHALKREGSWGHIVSII
jgi:hypothetical protein